MKLVHYDPKTYLRKLFEFLRLNSTTNIAITLSNKKSCLRILKRFPLKVFQIGLCEFSEFRDLEWEKGGWKGCARELLYILFL